MRRTGSTREPLWENWLAAAEDDDTIDETFDGQDTVPDAPVDVELWTQAVEGIAGLYVVRALEFLGDGDVKTETECDALEIGNEAAYNTVG